MRPAMDWKRKSHLALAAALVTLGMLLPLAQLNAPDAQAQAPGGPWPLTSDGRSHVAGWSPDGRTILVNRWGSVVGDGMTRQALSELWAVSIQGELSAGSGHSPVTQLSDNAVQPAYTPDGRRLAYLSFAGEGRWEARVLDLASGEEETHSTADWRMPPAWVDESMAFGRAGRVWLSHDAHGQGPAPMPADLPTLPAGAHVRLSAGGKSLAWSDGIHLWVQPGPGVPPRLLASGTQVLELAWSPDGRRLAYLVAAEDLSPALWVADVTRENAPTRLAQGSLELWSRPSWSPDGQRLAFSRAPIGTETASASDVWLVDADGTDLRPLLRNDLEESNPTWSPDGQYLAFERDGDVWVMDVAPPHPGAVPGDTQGL